MFAYDYFLYKKKIYVIFNNVCVLFFTLSFIITGYFENNLILNDNNLGLFQHPTIWIFIIFNFLLPILYFKIYKNIENNIDIKYSNLINIKYNNYKDKASVKIIFKVVTIIGFCFFIGNTLQNAKLFNKLPFNYWDSIDFRGSYILSRIYKFYLFTFFIPGILCNLIISICSISEVLVIEVEDICKYPIKNYFQLNILCSYGLNLLFVTLIPILFFTSYVYIVHDRFDFVSVSTIVFTIIISLLFFCLYLKLISKYQKNIIKYKILHMSKIDNEISNIHHKIMDYKINGNNSELLNSYLLKEKYLQNCEDKIFKISKFPLIIKAILTLIMPLFPTIFKFLILSIKNFFKI